MALPKLWKRLNDKLTTPIKLWGCYVTFERACRAGLGAVAAGNLCESRGGIPFFLGTFFACTVAGLVSLIIGRRVAA
jgi:ABC-type branched-subunit amino acid transport system permease subunit